MCYREEFGRSRSNGVGLNMDHHIGSAGADSPKTRLSPKCVIMPKLVVLGYYYYCGGWAFYDKYFAVFVFVLFSFRPLVLIKIVLTKLCV